MPWGPEPLVTHLPVPSLVKITQGGKVWWAPSIHTWFSPVVVSRRSTADAYGLFWRCRVLVLSWHQAGQLGMPHADTFPRSLQQHEQRCKRESLGSDQAIKSLRVAISCSCAQSPPRELCCRWDSFRKCSCHRNPSLIAAGGIVTELWGSREGSKQGEEQREPKATWCFKQRSRACKLQGWGCTRAPFGGLMLPGESPQSLQLPRAS